MRGIYLFITAALLGASSLQAQTQDRDTVEESTSHPFYTRGIIGKVKSYLDNTNKPKPDKKFDFSVIGGPHYSSDTKLGIGLVAAGLYRPNLADTITSTSDVSAYGDITTSGYYKLGISGHHFFPEDRWRIDYDVYFESNPDRFWGIGYDNANNDANETKYTRWQSRFVASVTHRIIPHLYVGPQIQIEYINGRKVADPTLWQGMAMHTFTNGAGIVGIYDTRDNVTNAYCGVYMRIDQMFYPKFTGNRYAFSSTELTLCHYRSVWRGGILAMQLHTRLTYGNTPWGLMSKMGGSSNMRGYYKGRYNDKSLADVTVELRQHVWRRSGIVAWVGAGQVFHNLSDIQMRHTLPNYGLGYRWEFKNRVNVRLDYGFGKHQSGFMFNINEAF